MEYKIADLVTFQRNKHEKLRVGIENKDENTVKDIISGEDIKIRSLYLYEKFGTMLKRLKCNRISEENIINKESLIKFMGTINKKMAGRTQKIRENKLVSAEKSVQEGMFKEGINLAFTEGQIQ